MYDDDADLIDQVSDDDDDDEDGANAMDEEGQQQRNDGGGDNNNNARNQQQQQRNNNQSRGNRLSDQVNMDDEPPLHGYERCVLLLGDSASLVLLLSWLTLRSFIPLF